MNESPPKDKAPQLGGKEGGQENDLTRDYTESEKGASVNSPALPKAPEIPMDLGLAKLGPATEEEEKAFQDMADEIALAEEREADRNRDVKETVHYITTTRGVGTYYMQKPAGDYLAMKAAQIKKHLQRAGMSKNRGDDGFSEIDHFLLDREMYSALDFAGNIAGYDAGIHEVGGTRFLSLRSPVTPSAIPGEHDTIDAVLNGLFPDEENLRRFQAWMYFAWEYLHKRSWAPLPVVATAGPRNSGKTLLINILKHVLGGTEPGQAIRYLRGETAFNSDLCAAHLLTCDDCIASTDPRSRQTVAQQIKTLAVTNSHRIEQKGYDPTTMNPHWRCLIACNDEPESLQILPPIDDGLRDKLLLLRCVRGEMPMPSATPEERKKFMDRLKEEIPGLLDHLSKQDWIHEYGDSRQKVTGWQDPELFDALSSLDAEVQLLDLIDTLQPWDRVSCKWVGTAAELEGMLTDPQSSTARKAGQLLNWSKACGTYLGRLSHSHSDRVQRGEVIRNREWEVTAP